MDKGDKWGFWIVGLDFGWRRNDGSAPVRWRRGQVGGALGLVGVPFGTPGAGKSGLPEPNQRAVLFQCRNDSLHGFFVAMLIVFRHFILSHPPVFGELRCQFVASGGPKTAGAGLPGVRGLDNEPLDAGFNQVVGEINGIVGRQQRRHRDAGGIAGSVGGFAGDAADGFQPAPVGRASRFAGFANGLVVGGDRHIELDAPAVVANPGAMREMLVIIGQRAARLDDQAKLGCFGQLGQDLAGLIGAPFRRLVGVGNTAHINGLAVQFAGRNLPGDIGNGIALDPHPVAPVFLGVRGRRRILSRAGYKGNGIAVLAAKSAARIRVEGIGIILDETGGRGQDGAVVIVRIDNDPPGLLHLRFRGLEHWLRHGGVPTLC